jgi:3-hydroxybutyryl-CoA dehydrogenase
MNGIQRILVIGAGIMGHGIALVAARSGFEVSLVDVSDEILQKGMAHIQKFLEGSLKRGKMTEEESNQTFSRIHTTTNMKGEAEKADFLIEAVVENKKVKSNLFNELHELCKAEIVFASNTSQLSITELGMASQRPGKFIGMH